MEDFIQNPLRSWLRREIKRLNRLFKKCRAENYSRTWYLDYVVDVNGLYKATEVRGSKKWRYYAQIEKDNNRRGRKDRHPLLTIFAATSSLSPKTLSRWSNALQCANSENMNMTKHELKQFLQCPKKGGMSGREKKFAKMRRRNSTAVPKVPTIARSRLLHRSTAGAW